MKHVSKAELNQPIELGKGVIVLTYGCNLKCSFCYAAAEVFDKPGIMKPVEAMRSMEFMASVGIKTVTLLGGEPTLYKGLTDVIEYGLELGVTSWIVTNGTRIAETDLGFRLFQSGLKGGCISFHGHTPIEHDTATRQIGSFELAKAALRKALDNGWPLYPMVTVMERNLETVLPLIEDLRGMGCKTIYINYGLPNISQEHNIGGDAGPMALAKLSEELFRLQKPLDARFIFNREKNKIPLCHFDYDTLKDMFADEIIGTGCEAVQGNTIVVEPGGSALGCSHWVEHPLLSIYEDFEKLKLRTPEEFWDIWTNGPPAEYRKSISDYPYEKCGDCGWRKSGMCYGGCKIWQESGIIPKFKKYEVVHAEPYNKKYAY